MSSQTVIDYLTKQIFIERNIVTYRLLSRDLRIHVNAAKNELATYHAIAPYQGQTCFATYAICGEVFADQARQSQGDTEDFDMEAAVDDDLDYEYDEGEDVPQTTIMLVNERDFENARSKFTRIDSIHVYSLAPAHIHDAGLLCTPTESVRTTDGKVGSEIAPIVGKIVGANIQLKPTAMEKVPAAGPSRRRPPADAASTSKPTAQAPIGRSSSKADITKEKSKIVADKPKEKPRPTGKLNFIKAKAKETKDEPKLEQDQKASSKTASTSDLKPTELKSKDEPRKDEKPSKEEVQRGTKRKSLKALMSESEDDKPSVSLSKQPSESRSKGNVRVKKRTVLSDDDDDLPSPHPRMSRMSLRAQSTVDSQAEQDLKALMDIDDDEVIRVARKEPVFMKEEQEESSEDAEAVQVDTSIAPKPKPKKRPEKKVVPVGRNGLKKKRVVKSRMTTDAKGYMVTEDYSSYESVDEEEEPEPAAPAKGKAKAKSSSKVKEEDSSTLPAPKIKPAKKASFGPDAHSAGAKATKSRPGTSKSGAPKQKPLMNFFTPQTKAKS